MLAAAKTSSLPASGHGAESVGKHTYVSSAPSTGNAPHSRPVPVLPVPTLEVEVETLPPPPLPPSSSSTKTTLPPQPAAEEAAPSATA